MTKCAHCRVRHRTCDSGATCKECKKYGRVCVRLNVRFRYLVCPTATITRADLRKYEFFFDLEQTWLDTKGKIDFVSDRDSSPTTSLNVGPDKSFPNASSLDDEPSPALAERSSPTFAFIPDPDFPTMDGFQNTDDPLEDLAAMDQVNGRQDNVIFKDLPADSLEATIPSRGSTACLLRGCSVGPLKGLQEGRLFQHWINHIAPWVRSLFPLNNESWLTQQQVRCW